MTSSDTPLQYKIIDSLNDIIKEGLLPSSSRRPGFKKDSRFYRQFKGFTREQLGYKIFNNYRVSKQKGPMGLRLTFLGNELLKQHYNHYEYNHKINPTPKMYLILDKTMEWPYYFTKKKMVLYSQEDSAWYKLNGSDINAFIQIK
jgi:hypothetical protein